MRTAIYSQNCGEHNRMRYHISAALALAVLAGCGKPPAPENARPQRETILMPESVRAESTGADISQKTNNNSKRHAVLHRPNGA